MFMFSYSHCDLPGLDTITIEWMTSAQDFLTKSRFPRVDVAGNRGGMVVPTGL